ncbi:MAG: hypothetical protein M1816_007651 [Peltula sp. TS41687]|nr:MAG: hypothetical protein M1816_007651 [Peltula sp. TS41687]
MPGKLKRYFGLSASKKNSTPEGTQSIQPLGSEASQRAPVNVSLPSSNHPPSQSNSPVLPTCTAGASALNHASRSSASPDLWAEALQRLSDKERAAIQHEVSSYRGSPQQPLSDTIDDLCSLTGRKRAEYEKQGWKLEYNGQQLILRDVAEKVIVWLNKFKDVGDVAINFDPVHAALPWAGVRFLLQSLVAESQQMGDLLVGVEKVTYLVSRCKIYETLYVYSTNPSQALANLRTALVELYATILRFLALANRLYDKNTFTRTFYAVLNPGEINSFIQSCQPLEERVDLEASNCERTYSHAAHTKLGKHMDQLKQLLKEMREPIVRTDDRVATLWDRSNQSERSGILSWTSNVPYEANHKTASEGRTADTGQWLLTHERYLQWRKSSASMILWLHGIPGAGKTKLASTVIDDMLRALNGQRNDEALAHFYCDHNDTKRQDPASVLRSFVRQLSTTRAGDAIQPSLVQLYQQKRQTGFASGILDMNECVDLLLKYVNIYPQTTLILDALDECDSQTRKQLILALDNIILRSSKPIKIFISSRPDEDIRYRFESGPSVGIQMTDNQRDINKFLTAKMEEDGKTRRNKLSSELKEDIVGTLSSKSQGMFQWAPLQIAQLLELDRESDIRLRLGKLPNDLKKAYDEIYDNIRDKPGSALEIAERAFEWVMCSGIPLSPVQLVAAVCQDPTTDNLDAVDIRIDFVIKACSNLLVIDPQLQVCRFSHLSVQEYLEIHRLKPVQAHNLVARVCLRVLSDDDLNRHGLELSPKYQALERDENVDSGLRKLLEYSRLYWPLHVQSCEEAEDDEQLSTLLMDFLGSMNESGIAYRRWHAALALMDFNQKAFAPAHAADRFLEPSSLASLAICFFGFYRVLSSWWGLSSLNVNQCNDAGDSLLALSAFKGFLPICQTLIELGAIINDEGGRYGNALQAASLRRHEKVVKLLPDKGADINMQGGEYGNALQAASLGGHEKIVSLLLDRGADINMQGGEYGNALQAASLEGHEKIVSLLLDRGADVNMQGGECGNALQAASLGGHEKIVSLLLDRGADVNMQGGECGNALHAASLGGHEKIVSLLLDRGADINMQGGEYGNALQAASLGGHEKIVSLLLDRGADVNMQGGRCGNALQAASLRGHEKIVSLLLDRGADVNMQGGEYGNALQAASYEGLEKIVSLLLDKGADINMQGGYFGNALQAASLGGHEKIVSLLLDRGADINMQGGKYGNALQAASLGGHEKIVSLLLDRGADINMQGEKYGNALQAASYEGLEKIVSLLLDKGADINMQGGYFGNALQAASLGGHEKIVPLLLDRGADIDRQGGPYGNALNAAAFGGHLTLLQLFFGNRFLVRDFADKQGRTALHLAARGGHLQAVDYLLDLGLDHNVRDKKGGTALHYAASGASKEVVRRLLEITQPSLVQNPNWTPLHWACRAGDSEVIQLLSSEQIKSGVVLTTDPPSLWTPLSIALLHQNRNLVSRQGNLLHDDIALQDIWFEPAQSDSDMKHPQQSKENPSCIQAKKHYGYYCDGCFHSTKSAFRYGRNPDATVEDIVHDLQASNEARNPPTPQNGTQPGGPIFSIISDVGQLGHRTGDSIKKAVTPAWFKSVGHALGGGSGGPVKLANPMLPANAIPPVVVP